MPERKREPVAGPTSAADDASPGANARLTHTLELDDTPGAINPLAPGATLGHFVIRRVLGEGGMGVVLEAYDPDLDRTVAIKLVGEDRRLVGEAQAMARLAHPNVVAVHEVGEADGRVFLVMEHVEGRTLGAWLAEAPRDWRAIVDVFVQAGEGLAAAHRALLVHRDVKPSNILVDAAGRVRVSDFGIARLELDANVREAAPRTALAGATAGVAGTPAYMAPEQRAHGAVDARADQYAFAVSLDEALRGARPPARVPARLRQAIARARAEDPAARWPSMAPLLAQLRAAIAPRRAVRPALVVAAVLIAAGAAYVMWPRSRAAADDCATGASLVDDVWSASAHHELAGAFAATGRAEAATSADAVARALDDYAGGWRLGRIAACHADPDARPRRLGCLDRRLGALRAQLAVWTRADAATVDAAVQAAAALPSIDACTDARAPTPSLAVAPLYARIDDGDARTLAGQSAQVAALAPALIADAEASGDAGVLEAALALAARAERDAGHPDLARDHAAQAARTAAALGDDRAMAEALLLQAAADVDAGQAAEALGLCDAADAIVVRAQLGDLDEAVLRRRGEALHHAGRNADAAVALGRAVELADQRAAADPSARLAQLTLASDLVLAADAQEGLAHYAEARTLITRGLAIEEAAYGPVHPEVAATLHDLAVAEGRLGQFDVARAHYTRAKAILVAVYGPDHEQVGLVEESLGSLALLAGDDAGALAHYRVARGILERALPADHPELANLYGSIAAVARDQDRCADAVPDFQRAVTGLDHAGITGLPLATMLTGLGVCLTETGRPAEGRPPLERALTELEAEHVAPHELVELHEALSECLWAIGDHAGAVAQATAGLGATLDDPDPVLVGSTDWFRGWFHDHHLKAPR